MTGMSEGCACRAWTGHCISALVHVGSRHGSINLQQPSQERNIVGPFLLGRVPEGEGALDTGRIPSESFFFLVQRCRGGCISHGREDWEKPGKDIRSSAAAREARGTGLERPDPVGEKTWRLAGGSADMLRLTRDIWCLDQWATGGHGARCRRKYVSKCVQVYFGCCRNPTRRTWLLRARTDRPPAPPPPWGFTWQALKTRPPTRPLQHHQAPGLDLLTPMYDARRSAGMLLEKYHVRSD